MHLRYCPRTDTVKNSSWLNSNWLLTGLLILVALLVWGTLRQGHDWGDDFASYIMQAQSIVSGSIPEFLAQNSFTIKGSNIRLGPIAYPWGTPLLLSPIVYLKGLDIQALKSLNILCFFLFLVLIWFGIKKYLSPGWGFLYFALFAFNPYLILFSLNSITSDIPFLLFSTICVVMIRCVIVEEKSIISQPVDLFLLGLVIAIATTVRLNGILLLALLLSTQAVRNYRHHSPDKLGGGMIKRLAAMLPRDRRDFQTQVIPYVVFFLFLAAWTVIFPGGGSYGLGEFARIKISSYFYHIYYYFIILIDFLYPLDQSWLLFEILVIFTTWGIWRRHIQDYDFLIYCILNALLLLVWGTLQGLRFIFPFLPLVIYFFLWGIQGYAEEIREKLRAPFQWGMSILLSGVVVIFVIFLTRDAVQNQSRGRITIDGPNSPNAQEVFTFISSNTYKKDVIIFFKPRALRLFTQRPSLALVYPKALEQGDYILLDLEIPPDQNPLDPGAAELLKQERKLDLVYQNGTYQLYAVKH